MPRRSERAAPGASPHWLLFRRELRGEKKLFLLAALTIAAATAALALVLALAASFDATYTEQARALIGGDYTLRLSQREFTADERRWLAANSARLSEVRSARVLALHGERTHLARLKGIDRHYPLYGALELRQTATSAAAALFDARGEPYPAFVDESLLQLLDLSVGDVFSAGGLTLRVVNVVTAEPDPEMRVWASAPLILIAKSPLQSADFMRPGALVSRHIRVALPPRQDPAAWRARLEKTFPDAGWRVSEPQGAQSSTRRAVDKVRAFLSLASLAAVLLAGIGCGNALSAFLRARLRAIAVIKMIGGGARLVRAVYLSITASFAVGGAAAGAFLGMGAAFVVAPLLSPYLPSPLQITWSTTIVLRALLTSLLMAAAFAVPPILRHSRANPLLLFAAGDGQADGQTFDWHERLVVAAGFLTAAVALPVAWLEKLILLGVIAFAALLYGALLLLTAWLETLLRRAPGAWRLGLLAVTRQRHRSAAAVTSFSVGIFVLIAIINAENNFAERISGALQQQAPAIYLVGIHADQVPALDGMIGDAGGRLRAIPFLRGRITAIGGRSAAEIAGNAPDGEQWILRGDRGLTWSDGGYIGGSYVTHGQLWDPNVEGLQASFDEEAAQAFGVGVGDALELNIIGEPVTAVITSLRRIDWQSMDINFVVILSRAPFAEAPYTYMGGAYLPESQTPTLQLAIAEDLPNVLPIATAPIFKAAKELFSRTAVLLQAIALFLLLAGAPMLAATLIENRRARLRSAATLRLLGTSRRAIFTAGLVEFGVMAVLAALPAALLGTFAGNLITTMIFDLEWQSHWRVSAAIGGCALALFLIIGGGDVARAARRPPLALLRNE